MAVGAGSLGKLVGGKVKFSDALDFNSHITHHFVLKQRSLGPRKKKINNIKLDGWMRIPKHEWS